MNLSFAGCGFLGIYHVGVAVCFKKYAPHLLVEKISGASAGALAGICLLCDVPLGEMTSDFFRVVNEARSHSLGPFSPKFNIQTCLLRGLQKFLPDDAHERVNGRINISVTRVYDGKNVIINQFNSREDVLQALLCACFIPGFSGLLPPRFHGVRYMDGAFSDNLPILDENTVTVSPFCGESDICPRDQSSQLFHVNWANTSIEFSKQNINRFARILFPPRAEVLSTMCQQGFDDALQYLHRNNLISCTRCLAVQSTFTVKETTPSVDSDSHFSDHYDPECKDCNEHRKDAMVGNMPENVLTVFQTYIEMANKGLANWMFRHRSVKLLHALSLPATLPADIICATLTNIVGGTIEKKNFRMQIVGQFTEHNCYENGTHTRLHHLLVPQRLISAAPSICNQLSLAIKYIMDQIEMILSVKRTAPLNANISCQVSLTECGLRAEEDDLASNTIYTTDQIVKSPSKRSLSKRSSKVDIFMTERPPSTTDANTPHLAPYHHRASGVGVSGDEDTFDQILNVTSHQESVYSYYYTNEHNAVLVTEIFDVTDSDQPEFHTNDERELNQKLEFDDDIDPSCESMTMKGYEHMRAYINDVDDLPIYGAKMICEMDYDDDGCDILGRKLIGPSVQIEEIENDSEPEVDQSMLTSDDANVALNRPSYYQNDLH